MIKVEHIETWGIEGAIRGMRNPLNSWHRSDSCWYYEDSSEEKCGYSVGKNDLDLMRRLYKGGTEHRKYLRMIHIQMDITAPLYWWKEMDQYRIAVTTNSCSTMHKIHDKRFTLGDFSCEQLYVDNLDLLTKLIERLNIARGLFIKTKDKKCWWQMIQLLPSSYNQKRTIDFNYETAINMIHQRSGHKLDEWREFVEVLKGLPCMKEILEVKDENFS